MVRKNEGDPTGAQPQPATAMGMKLGYHSMARKWRDAKNDTAVRAAKGKTCETTQVPI